MTWYSSWRSISVNKLEAPNRKSSGSIHSRPSSSFIRINQAIASLAVRIPPAGFFGLEIVTDKQAYPVVLAITVLRRMRERHQRASG